MPATAAVPLTCPGKGRLMNRKAFRCGVLEPEDE
ncbi:MAG: hypothetical protein QOJ16_2251 [Acidobacteriota bacterium]|nr:hypothetical protein [Acidobacteriota bacterium]